MNFIVAEIASHLNKKIPNLAVSVSLLKKMFQTNAKTVGLNKVAKLAETIEKWISEDVFSGEKIAEKYNFRAEMPISEALRRQVEAYQAKKNRR